jgi:cytochrome c oxidase assembly protein subunit 15
MISIGGLTRLTNSGLSITEWNPISGILPPLSDHNWEIEFDKYKKSPEYITYNFNITLPEFKSIYLVEFIHRIAGRITGLVYILPLILFVIIGRIRNALLATHSIVTFLFMMQGFVGWYMVKSGLANSPHVSHYRLAMHLFLAIIMYCILFWQLMKNSFDILLIPTTQKNTTAKSWLIFSIAILFIQIILGAFTAGLSAGLVYNTFPYMGEFFVPDEVYHSFYDSFVGTKFLNEPVFVQFLHRNTAYILTIVVTLTCIYIYKVGSTKLNKCAFYILVSLGIQVVSGIITLIYSVPIATALIHQFGAVLLLSALLWALFLIMSVK